VSRGHVPGLASPHPMGDRLPAVYLEDSLVQRMTSALDEVLAPVFSSLDNLDAYLDPALAPEDFLQWLGTWVGMALDESWPPERRRAVLAAAVGLYRVRGTAGGLAAYLRLLTGADVEIEESGGTSWSQGAYPSVPGTAGFRMLVRVREPEGVSLNAARIDALVSAAKPAHVVHRVQIVPFAAPSAPPPLPAAGEEPAAPPPA
jgi:phage tail-like protein